MRTSAIGCTYYALKLYHGHGLGYAEKRGVSKLSQGRAQLQKFNSEVLNQLNFALDRSLKELAARREHTEPFVRAWNPL